MPHWSFILYNSFDLGCWKEKKAKMQAIKDKISEMGAMKQVKEEARAEEKVQDHIYFLHRSLYL